MPPILAAPDALYPRGAFIPGASTRDDVTTLTRRPPGHACSDPGATAFITPR